MAAPVIETGAYKLQYTLPKIGGGGDTIDLGYFDSEGMKITKKTFKQMFKTDLYGDEEYDGVYTGQGWLIEMVVHEYSDETSRLGWWDKDENFIGRLISSISESLLLTPVDGIAPVAKNSPDGRPTKIYQFPLALPLGDVATLLKTGNPPKELPLAFGVVRDFSQSVGEQYMIITDVV